MRAALITALTLCVGMVACASGESGPATALWEKNPSPDTTSNGQVPGTLPPVDLDGDGIADPIPPDVEDLRVLFTLPNGDNVLTVEMPAMIVPPGKEALHCNFQTYTGPDVGVVSGLRYFTPEYYHHTAVYGLAETGFDLQQNVVTDCTNFDFGTIGGTDLFQLPDISGNPKAVVGGKESDLGLPEGVGFALLSGTRFYTDSHYINVTDHPILVNAGFAMELVPREELKGYAAPYIFSAEGVIEIPITDKHHIQYDCVWQQDTSILELKPHMHDHGLEFAVDWTSAQGTKRVMEIKDWVYDDSQYVLTYEDGEFEVKKGDIFTTHCTWSNNTDHVIIEPEEMCTTWGLAYPLEIGIDCNGNAANGSGRPDMRRDRGPGGPGGPGGDDGGGNR